MYDLARLATVLRYRCCVGSVRRSWRDLLRSLAERETESATCGRLRTSLTLADCGLFGKPNGPFCFCGVPKPCIDDLPIRVAEPRVRRFKNSVTQSEGCATIKLERRFP